MARTTTKTTAAKKTAAKKTTATAPKDDAAEAQFPSLEGNEKVEIAARSQDIEAESADAHRKVFVVLKREWEESDKAARNLANIEATRQAMIGQGLRPTGDGRYVSSKAHPDGVSLILTYEVPCTPAAIATDAEPHVKHAHVTLDDQHAAENDDA